MPILRQRQLAAAEFERVHPRCRAAVKSMAAKSPQLVDLALSFPALLFSLACRRRHMNADEIMADVNRGRPLAEIAALAAIPMWARKLPISAFQGPLPDLPDGELFRRQIANHIPRSRRKLWTWLTVVSFAGRWCGDDFAIWCAREFNRAGKKFNKQQLPQMVLWAWQSLHGEMPWGILEARWQPSLGFAKASEFADKWLDSVATFLGTGTLGLVNHWLNPGDFDGYAFVPLKTAEAIVDEAGAMNNCMRGFGEELQDNTLKFWSVRREGERVAVLSIVRERKYPIPYIGELCGPANRDVPHAVWVAAAKWLGANDLVSVCAERLPERSAEISAALWQGMWRSYWLDRGKIPAWLPLRPRSNWKWRMARKAGLEE